MPRRKPPARPPVPEWVVTYGDLMSLLLTFFILLAAFSELKREREYLDVVRSVKEAFGFTGGIGRVPSEADPENVPLNLPMEDFQKFRQELKAMAEVPDPNLKGRNERVSIITPGEYFVIGGSLPFEAGSAELSEAVRQILREKVCEQIKGRRNKILIRGHAYGQEDRLRSGLDLRELSFKRAQAVTRFLIEECGVDPRLLETVAVGDAEPLEIERHSTRPASSNWRVQVVMTGNTIDQVHPDPYGTGRE